MARAVLMIVMLSSVCCALVADATQITTMRIAGESLVLAGRLPGNLMFADVVPGSIAIRSTYELGDDTIVYEQGRDYVVNYTLGTIARSPASRMPDFAKNMLYGQNNFDHSKFPGFSNHPFFVWVDYETRAGKNLAVKSNQSALLSKTRKKLEAGGPFKLIAFGDSISTGCETSREGLRFQNLYAQALMKIFPKAQISVEMGATGGDTTLNGLERIEEKVLSRSPDLVLVAFGMNDHNVPPFGVGLDKFEENLGHIINLIRTRTGAEIILLSTLPPNPDWAFGSHQMDKYAAATKRVAEKKRVAYADVFSVWSGALVRKDPQSLLGNNINHPNDFGHWLYLQALKAVEF
ncbi:MAG: hypothetical protein GX141_11900 [Armatimonadetes bacterium]|nr:hypothetical protein [Armatimonadota bacterium]